MSRFSRGRWECSGRALVPALALEVESPSAGQSHACAVVNGGFRCWGNNAYGELGNNSTTESQVTVLQRVQAAATLAAGDYHPCSLTNGGPNAGV